MKKALVLALTAFMVLALATAAFAVEVSYEGKVEVKWEGSSEKDGDPGFAAGDYEASVNIDLTKDFGDGVSAGANIKIDPTAKSKVEHKWNDDDEDYEEGEVASADAVKLDGAGWIKIEKDLFAVTAKTEIDGNAAKDLGAEWGLAGAAGVQVDVTAIDGLTLTGLINAGPQYNFLAKAEYSADALALGAGFQKHGKDKDETYDVLKDAFAVWASYEVIDGLTLAGEFASRTDNSQDKAEAMTAILGKASYANGVLTVDAAFLNQKEGFVTQNEDDADDFLARDFMKLYGFEGNVLYIDASYAITDALKVSGAFDYVLSAKVGEADVLKNFKDLFDEDFALSYKVAADYDLTEKIAFGVWYKGYGNANELGGKAVYTFAEGVTGTFELTNGKGHNGVDLTNPLDPVVVEPDAVTKYSFVLSAEF